MKYDLTVKSNDEGELYIELPEQLLEIIGWTDGDTIVWLKGEDSYTLRKADDTSNKT